MADEKPVSEETPEVVQDNDDVTVNDGTEERPKLVPLEKHLKQRDRLRDAEARVEALEKKATDAERAKLDKEERLQLEVNDLKTQSDRADRLDGTIKKILDSAIESVPEDKRSLIPASLSPEDQLEYIETNRALLTTVPKVVPTTPKPADNTNTKTVDIGSLSAEDKARADRFYDHIPNKEERHKKWAENAAKHSG